MSKKTILLSIVYTLAAILSVAALISEFIFRPERNLSEKAKIIDAVIRTVIFVILAVRYFRINTRGARNVLLLQYLPFFGGAFTKDKKSFRKLLSIGKLLNKGQFEKAYTEVELLKKECRTIDDRCALLQAEVLCLNGRMRYDTALNVLEMTLLENPKNSTAYALRALLYHHFDKHVQALSAIQILEASISTNYIVPLCKAILHFNRSEYTEAYTSAKNAITISYTSTLSMFVAYKSSLALNRNDLADYYHVQITKFGSNLKDLEQYSKAFLMK